MAQNQQITEIAHKIETALLKDRYRLRRQWKSIQQKRSDAKPFEREFSRFQKLLAESLAIVEKRKRNLPKVDFDQDLPISEHRDEIITALDEHQVIVVCGETGSGKSTQLPKTCLAAGYGVTGMIGHTQPRRIAARSIANRLADELQKPLGKDVGFKIRFTDETNRDTYIKLMTDGILLAETQGDRYLEQYDVIIIDEAHERSLNIDFLLGYLRRLLPQRPELRLIITSATIDADRFGRHFAINEEPAPVIEVSGRTYPVEVRYRPIGSDARDETDADLNAGIVEAVHELAEIDEGHILIFLPTERDIRETAKRLRTESFTRGSKTEILPLYARLSAAEQNRVFQSVKHRRIVLATNVAESSLTVPNIRYVIDTGTARISRYSPRSKVQRLPIESISKASADQRKGRCGRISAGVAIRLYPQEDYENRSAYTTPEIQRTNLASVILQATALKLGRVEDFPFLDPPRPDTIRDGYKTLFEIGAVDERKELTKVGQTLSRLPVDPRIGRIIVAGDREACLHEVLIIAAALEVQDPRDRPHDKRQSADEQHEKFSDQQSDFISYLKLWDFYHDLRKKLSHSKLRKACQQNFLSYSRLREWCEVHRQLQQLAKSNGFHQTKRKDNYDSIHRALLCGFLWGTAHRSGDHEYTGAGGIKFHLWPGSGLFSTKPKWCVTAERIETTRRYGRTVAAIDPKWIEPLAAHLVKRHYSDPHFHRKSGRVMAFESVTLFGLPLVQRRRVAYGSIDVDVSREIFIREGLAARQLEIHDRFYTHNQSIVDQVSKLAAKSRKADYLVDNYILEMFYDERLPRDVVDLESLRRWLKKTTRTATSDSKAARSNAVTLKMTVDDLLPKEDGKGSQTIDEEQFPSELQLGAVTLPVEYHFAPGEENDGVTVTIPEDGISHLQAADVEWLVPGLLEEKIVAMIRSLPKPIRRNVIPAPDTAKKIASEIIFGKGDFMAIVRDKLSSIAGEPIPTDAFRTEKIPEHLRMNVRIVDHEGNVTCESRDIEDLRRELGRQVETEISLTDDSQWHRDGITEWDFGELPEEVMLNRGGIQVPGYPALIDTPHELGHRVSLRLLGSKYQSAVKTREGIRRLYILKKKKAIRSQVNWLPELDNICLYAAGLLDKATLKRQLSERIADRAFFGSREKLPRNAEQFLARLDNANDRIGGATQDVARLLPKIFEAYHQVKLAMETCGNNSSRFAYEDVKQQMANLMTSDFLITAPWPWLIHYPRFLQAVVYRIDRLGSGTAEKDRRATAEIDHYWQRMSQVDVVHSERNREELDQFRWMVEEYRVSCFAQTLGTSLSISAKRLDKQWAKVISVDV